MTDRCDRFEYVFQWTDFASTEHFKEKRRSYIIGIPDAQLVVDIDMPTPLPNKRTMANGPWEIRSVRAATGECSLRPVRPAS